MKEAELYEKIEDYIKKRLSKEEQLAFEREIAADSELADQVALHHDLIAATGEKEVAAFRKQMDAIIRDDDLNAPAPAGKRIVMRRSILAVAASVLLIASFSFWQNHRYRQNVFSNVHRHWHKFSIEMPGVQK